MIEVADPKVVRATCRGVIDTATLAGCEVEIVDGAAVVVVARLEAVRIGGCVCEHDGLSGHPRVRPSSLDESDNVAKRRWPIRVRLSPQRKKEATGWPHVCWDFIWATRSVTEASPASVSTLASGASKLVVFTRPL